MKGMITKDRFSQLKKVYQKNVDKKILKDLSKEQKKGIFYSYLLDDIEKNNSKKAKPLQRFISSYLGSLEKSQLDYLWNKISNYVLLLENADYYEYNVPNFSDKLLQIIQYPEEFKLKDVFFELLFNFVYLPEYKNQKQFQNDMIGIVSRLDNFLHGYLFDGNDIQFKNINTIRVWDIIQETKGEDMILVKQHIKHEIVEKIVYSVDLPAYEQTRVNDLSNEIGITFLLKYDKFKIDLQSEINNFFEEKFDIDNEGNFLFGNFPELSVHLEISESGLSGLEEYDGKEYFEVRVYTKPKSFSIDGSYYEYINSSNKYLTYAATNISKLFDYDEIYQNIINTFKENIGKEKLDKAQIKTIKKDLEIYLDHKKVEKITSLLKEGENKKAKKLIKDYILEKKYDNINHELIDELVKEIENIDDKIVFDRLSMKLESYIGEKKTDKIINLIQNGEIEKAKKLLKKYLVFIGLRTIEKSIIDFNDALEEAYEKAQKNNEEENLFATNKDSKKDRLLKRIEVDNLTPILILDEKVEKSINNIISYLQKKEQIDKKLLKPRKGAIFFGKPGLGKTESVGKIAKESGLDLYTLNISQIFDMYVGESEKHIQQAFDEFNKILESKKAILFIDEADGLFGTREDKSSSYKDGVRKVVLEEIESLVTKSSLNNGFIILSTNFSENIDKAMKQRLGLYVEFKIPTKQLRYKMLDEYIKYLEEKGNKFENIDINKIVDKTSGWSYRELAALLDITIFANEVNEGKKISTDDILSNLESAKEKENNGPTMGFNV